MIGLNSGVLLLHLERMRADDDVWSRMLHEAAAKLEQQPPLVRLGWLADQTFVSFLAAWQFGANSLYPPHAAPLGDRLYTVPCGWNRQLSVHAANGPAPNFWPNWASCTEPCRFAQLYQCRKSAPGDDNRVIPPAPKRAIRLKWYFAKKNQNVLPLLPHRNRWGGGGAPSPPQVQASTPPRASQSR